MLLPPCEECLPVMPLAETLTEFLVRDNDFDVLEWALCKLQDAPDPERRIRIDGCSIGSWIVSEIQVKAQI